MQQMHGNGGRLKIPQDHLQLAVPHRLSSLVVEDISDADARDCRIDSRLSRVDVQAACRTDDLFPPTAGGEEPRNPGVYRGKGHTHMPDQVLWLLGSSVLR